MHMQEQYKILTNMNHFILAEDIYRICVGNFDLPINNTLKLLKSSYLLGI